MGAVKSFLENVEELAAQMCIELIKTHNEQFPDTFENESVKIKYSTDDPRRVANWLVTAREIMIQAVNHFWQVRTDGDMYIVEPDCLNEIFEIDWANKSFRIDEDSGGGGYL